MRDYVRSYDHLVNFIRFSVLNGRKRFYLQPAGFSTRGKNGKLRYQRNMRGLLHAVQDIGVRREGPQIFREDTL